MHYTQRIKRDTYIHNNGEQNTVPENYGYTEEDGKESVNNTQTVWSEASPQHPGKHLGYLAGGFTPVP